MEVLNYDQLAPMLQKDDGKTYVINFWATWCKPCVEELPAFEKLHETYKDKNVEVILVSLDFPNQIESELIPFIKDRNLQPKVIVLDDPNQNKWINGIDKSWSGSIPATLIYNKNKRSFFEQSFSYELLTKELQQFIN
ncbi:TlpA disulfide reductase family protein [Tenacibaculum sp. M341]|uniref:TlpA disulfide reductase family protein n=1 Tax=Tenacibaculum sp. M341 TaxID=2530339 RepID=UPI001FB5215E|nr:TlpA disulfide reductase family protein [Tenacibaculum sp. M341]